MDIISFNEASTANGRIESFIENPDSSSGVVTVPKVIASGETITIPSGRVAVLPNVQIDGTLNVQGDIFIPSGATLSGVVEKVTSTDNAIVRFNGTTGDVQNSGVIIDDNGNVGIGTGSPDFPLEVVGNDTTVKISNNNTGLTTTALQIGGYSGSPLGIYGSTLRSIHNFGFSSDSSLAFELAGTERMRIDANGNLLVGTSVDNGIDKLQVNGSMSDVDISRKLEVGFTTTIGTGQTYIANLQDLVVSNGLSSGIYLVSISMNGHGGPYWTSVHTFVTYIPSGTYSTYNACPANVMKSNSWYHHREASEHIFYTDSSGSAPGYGQLSLYCSAAVSYQESGVVGIKRLLNN